MTLVNGTATEFEPIAFQATMQSGNVEAESMYITSLGVLGAPSTVLLPGREAVFRIAFAVSNPADLVMEVRPGFEYDSAIFTT